MEDPLQVPCVLVLAISSEPDAVGHRNRGKQERSPGNRNFSMKKRFAGDKGRRTLAAQLADFV